MEKNNIISEWLDKYGDPEIDKFIEIQLNQNKMKQTAVEWLEKKFQSLGFDFEHILKQAKAMEKEQIKDAFVECWKANVPDGIECKLDAEQYYNKTFKSE